MAQPALWAEPSTLQHINHSPYSRTLQQIDQEARINAEAKVLAVEEGRANECAGSATNSPSSDSSSEDDGEVGREDCVGSLCAETIIPREELEKLQKQQAWLRGGASKAVEDRDTSSIRSKSTPRKRVRAPGVLETVFLPRTSAAKSKSTTMTRRHSTVEGSLKASSISTPSVAPSIRSERTTASSRKDRPKTLSMLSLFGPPPPPAAPLRVECITCLSDDVLIRRSAKLECGHRMCHTCLTRIFKLSTTDPQLMPPRCCTENVIPLRHVDRLFDADFKRTWNRKFAEYTTRNRLYCPTKGCGHWIKPKYIEMDRATGRRVGTCRECKTKVCKKCGTRWHGIRDCHTDDGTKRVIELGQENGWQRCYNCRTMVQLAEGCNHMRCHCNAEFCMVCGSKWKTCDCSWFNVPPDILNINNFMLPGQPQAWGVAPPPPPPFDFLDRRDVPLDPMNLPDMFRPPDLPPLPRPRTRRARTIPGIDAAPSREAQEAADEALARQLAEQDLLGEGSPLVEPSNDLPAEERSRHRAARRARRRVYAINEDEEVIEYYAPAADPEAGSNEPTGNEAAMAGLLGSERGRVESWRRHI
ncbi:hypothetical protein EJ08DRAFT_647875 [Tothia fuscella]|uniref:RBR-type E3 ubiquitin transferase n=1 Tax=Tothia fuscella TaxID=1048955 RepID=A0A9P4NW49_9PEZI|nr:hypothetical protein EJ08DRAFT_647875 [Tothia fuscella]